MADDDDVDRLAAILDHLDLDEEALANHSRQVETAYRNGFDGTVVMLLNTFFETLVREGLADDLAEDEKTLDEVSRLEVREDDDIGFDEYMQEAEYSRLLDEAGERGYLHDGARERLKTLQKRRTDYVKKGKTTEQPAGVDVEAMTDWYGKVLKRSRYDITIHPEREEHAPPHSRTEYIREHIEEGLLQPAAVYIYSQLAADLDDDDSIGREATGMSREYRDTENIAADRTEEVDLKGNAWMHLKDMRKQYVHRLSSYSPDDRDQPSKAEVMDWFAVMEAEEYTREEPARREGQRQEGEA